MIRIVDELAAVFHKDNFLFALLSAILAWISPALELIVLLYALATVDWILDIRTFLKDKSPKIELWRSITRPTIEKLFLYSVLALSTYAVQRHLFYDSIPLYVIVMTVPISGELISITKTVEEGTGIRVVSKIQELFNNFLGTKSKVKEDENQ